MGLLSLSIEFMGLWPKVYIIVDKAWEFGVPVMENFIPASMVWEAIATKHDY